MNNDPTSFYCSGCKITHAGECEPRIVNIETGETLADMFMREAAILQLGQTLSVPEPPKADHGGIYYAIYNDGSVFYSDEFAQKVIAKAGK